MCGIAGYLSPTPTHGSAPILMAMTRALRRRGPDDEGFVLIDSAEGRHLDFAGEESDRNIRDNLPAIELHDDSFSHDVAFGHRRYSIIDLSSDGHQPMWDAGGNACVSFYGEIYNYVELRHELQSHGAVFRTNSDTEVILMAYLQWGTGAFSRFNGPFAISLYDNRLRKVLLARDRIGKASFYYTVRDDRVHWATEIKSFLEALGTSRFTVNEQAVDDFLTVGMRDYGQTFWTDIHDFPPASFAWIQPDLTLKIERYWHLPNSRQSARDINPDEAIEKLRLLIKDAIRIRQRADVPVAFELSGGMDSSAIVSLAAASASSPIATFTVKNEEAYVDEEPFARSVIEFYPDKIESKVLIPKKNDFWDAADEFVWVVEEPFHSPNLQTNQQLRRMMRTAGFKVGITGSAGDEVLAGYSSEYYGPYLRYLLRRGAISRFLKEVTTNNEVTVGQAIRRLVLSFLVPQSIRSYRIKRPIRHNLSGIYRSRYVDIVSPGQRAVTQIFSFEEIMSRNMGRRKMNYWLRSGPKAMFGIPLEPRSPLLDYRIVEFAFTLPPEFLIRDGWFKWILRQAVKDLLPENVVWRKKKMGFPFPLREWLASSKTNVDANLRDIDCPFIDSESLMASYDRLIESSPEILWRLISLALWWRKVIEGKTVLSVNSGANS